MQLKVERGAPATGKTIRLRQIAKADGQSEQEILVGRHCTPDALARSVRWLANRGANVTVSYTHLTLPTKRIV